MQPEMSERCHLIADLSNAPRTIPSRNASEWPLGCEYSDGFCKSVQILNDRQSSSQGKVQLPNSVPEKSFKPHSLGPIHLHCFSFRPSDVGCPVGFVPVCPHPSRQSAACSQLQSFRFSELVCPAGLAWRDCATELVPGARTDCRLHLLGF
ncbi:hypothetical protein BJX76DRAFT_220521 [Aspergillus varians]